MENSLASEFLAFYEKLLKPQFDAILLKQEEHDERFADLIGHFDSIYHRLGRLEDELLMVNNRLKRIEESVEAGNLKRSDLEKKAGELRQQMMVLQGRLEAIERQLGA